MALFLSPSNQAWEPLTRHRVTREEVQHFFDLYIRYATERGIEVPAKLAHKVRVAMSRRSDEARFPRLSLKRAHISDNQVKVLALVLWEFPILGVLDLRYNDVTHHGVGALLELMRHQYHDVMRRHTPSSPPYLSETRGKCICLHWVRIESNPVAQHGGMMQELSLHNRAGSLTISQLYLAYAFLDNDGGAKGYLTSLEAQSAVSDLLGFAAKHWPPAKAAIDKQAVDGARVTQPEFVGAMLSLLHSQKRLPLLEQPALEKALFPIDRPFTDTPGFDNLPKTDTAARLRLSSPGEDGLTSPRPLSSTRSTASQRLSAFFRLNGTQHFEDTGGSSLASTPSGTGSSFFTRSTRQVDGATPSGLGTGEAGTQSPLQMLPAIRPGDHGAKTKGLSNAPLFADPLQIGGQGGEQGEAAAGGGNGPVEQGNEAGTNTAASPPTSPSSAAPASPARRVEKLSAIAKRLEAEAKAKRDEAQLQQQLQQQQLQQQQQQNNGGEEAAPVAAPKSTPPRAQSPPAAGAKGFASRRASRASEVGGEADLQAPTGAVPSRSRSPTLAAASPTAEEGPRRRGSFGQEGGRQGEEDHVAAAPRGAHARRGSAGGARGSYGGERASEGAGGSPTHAERERERERGSIVGSREHSREHSREKERSREHSREHSREKERSRERSRDVGREREKRGKMASMGSSTASLSYDEVGLQAALAHEPEAREPDKDRRMMEDEEEEPLDSSWDRTDPLHGQEAHQGPTPAGRLASQSSGEADAEDDDRAGLHRKLKSLFDDSNLELASRGEEEDGEGEDEGDGALEDMVTPVLAYQDKALAVPRERSPLLRLGSRLVSPPRLPRAESQFLAEQASVVSVASPSRYYNKSDLTGSYVLSCRVDVVTRKPASSGLHAHGPSDSGAWMQDEEEEDVAARVEACGEGDVLSLRACGLTSLDLSRCLSDRAHWAAYVREMDLSSNQLKDLDAGQLGFALLASLEALDLSHNLFSDMRPKHGDFPPSLTCLDLSDNLLRSIRGLESCPALTRLDVSSNAIRFIDGIQHLTCLATLDVSHNLISTSIALRALSFSPSIRCLNISANPVDGTTNGKVAITTFAPFVEVVNGRKLPNPNHKNRRHSPVRRPSPTGKPGRFGRFVSQRPTVAAAMTRSAQLEADRHRCEDFQRILEARRREKERRQASLARSNRAKVDVPPRQQQERSLALAVPKTRSRMLKREFRWAFGRYLETGRRYGDGEEQGTQGAQNSGTEVRAVNRTLLQKLMLARQATLERINQSHATAKNEKEDAEPAVKPPAKAPMAKAAAHTRAAAPARPDESAAPPPRRLSAYSQDSANKSHASSSGSKSHKSQALKSGHVTEAARLLAKVRWEDWAGDAEQDLATSVSGLTLALRLMHAGQQEREEGTRKLRHACNQVGLLRPLCVSSPLQESIDAGALPPSGPEATALRGMLAKSQRVKADLARLLGLLEAKGPFDAKAAAQACKEVRAAHHLPAAYPEVGAGGSSIAQSLEALAQGGSRRGSQKGGSGSGGRGSGAHEAAPPAPAVARVREREATLSSLSVTSDHSDSSGSDRLPLHAGACPEEDTSLPPPPPPTDMRSTRRPSQSSSSSSSHTAPPLAPPPIELLSKTGQMEGTEDEASVEQLSRSSRGSAAAHLLASQAGRLSSQPPPPPASSDAAPAPVKRVAMRMPSSCDDEDDYEPEGVVSRYPAVARMQMQREEGGSDNSGEEEEEEEAARYPRLSVYDVLADEDGQDGDGPTERAEDLGQQWVTADEALGHLQVGAGEEDEEEEGEGEKEEDEPEWVEGYDDHYHQFFYFNEATGASQWTKPDAPFVPFEADDADADATQKMLTAVTEAADENHSTRSSVSSRAASRSHASPPMPPSRHSDGSVASSSHHSGSAAVSSAVSSAHSHAASSMSQSQSSKQDQALPGQEEEGKWATADGGLADYSYPEEAGTQGGGEEAEVEWIEGYDEQFQRFFYFHEGTGVSQWTKPDAAYLPFEAEEDVTQTMLTGVTEASDEHTTPGSGPSISRSRGPSHASAPLAPPEASSDPSPTSARSSSSSSMRLSASKGSSKGKASSGASAVSSAVSSAHSPASSSRQDQSLPGQEGEAEPEWVEGYDEKFQRFFYFNEATGVSQWTKPDAAYLPFEAEEDVTQTMLTGVTEASDEHTTPGSGPSISRSRGPSHASAPLAPPEASSDPSPTSARSSSSSSMRLSASGQGPTQGSDNGSSGQGTSPAPRPGSATSGLRGFFARSLKRSPSNAGSDASHSQGSGQEGRKSRGLSLSSSSSSPAAAGQEGEGGAKGHVKKSSSGSWSSLLGGLRKPRSRAGSKDSQGKGEGEP